MSTLWIWTPSAGVKVADGYKPTDCLGACHMAEPLLRKNAADICCHHFTVDTAAGKKDVYLVWICEDYDRLIDFLKSPAGEPYREKTGEISPPSHRVQGF